MLLTLVLHHKRLSFILAIFSYGHLNKLDTSSLSGSLRSDATVGNGFYYYSMSNSNVQ